MTSLLKIGDELLCSRCGYQWKPKKENPKSCPRCKRRIDYGSFEKKTL